MSRQIMILMFIALCATDVALTNRALAAGGWEANPLMAHAQATLGAAWWLPKALITLGAALIMSRWPPRAVAAAVALMAVVVVNNALQ